MSLRFGSGWLVIYFLICSCTFICSAPQLRARDYTTFNPFEPLQFSVTPDTRGFGSLDREDLLLMPGEHVLRRDLSDGAVQTHVVVFSDQRRTKSTIWSRVSCGTQIPVRVPQLFFLGPHAPPSVWPALHPSSGPSFPDTRFVPVGADGWCGLSGGKRRLENTLLAMDLLEKLCNKSASGPNVRPI